MKFTTLIAAAALATVSTAAFAENNVTTNAGELVMIEKNQAAGMAGFAGATGALVPALVAVVVAAAAAGGGTK